MEHVTKENVKGVVTCQRTVDGGGALSSSLTFFSFSLFLLLSFFLSFLFLLPLYFLALTALFFGPYCTISKKSGTHNEYQKSPG